MSNVASGPRKHRATHRIRRSAEEARSALLDAAERRLIEVGPGGIRLQEVAAEVGVSHPTLLHHFGTREGLITAAVTRAFAALDQEVLEAVTSVPANQDGAGALLERIFRALSERGHARVLAWLALSGFRRRGRATGLDVVVEAVHARRCAARAAKEAPPPTLEDTRFVVLLASVALFGQAVAGQILLRELGYEDLDRAGARFRGWLGRLLLEHLESA